MAAAVADLSALHTKLLYNLFKLIVFVCGYRIAGPTVYTGSRGGLISTILQLQDFVTESMWFVFLGRCVLLLDGSSSLYQDHWSSPPISVTKIARNQIGIQTRSWTKVCHYPINRPLYSRSRSIDRSLWGYLRVFFISFLTA